MIKDLFTGLEAGMLLWAVLILFLAIPLMLDEIIRWLTGK